MNPYSSTARDLSDPRPWYVCPQTDPEARARLFLFPYAGGGPSVYTKWMHRLPGHLESFIAHYPGRGSRYREPAIRQLSVLVESLYCAIQPLLDKPFAFFGHSLGGLIAFELARHLRRNQRPQPAVLFVSAAGAPHLPDDHQAIHALPDDEFLDSVRQLNGIPAELLGEPEALQLLLPALRADLEALECYRYAPDQAPLDVPLIVFGGLADPRVDRERLKGWALHTNLRFKLRYFPGDHFFIRTAGEAVLDAISAELTAAHAKH